MKYILLLLFGLSISFSLSASEVICNGSKYNVKNIELIKDGFINDDYGFLSTLIDFPIKKQIYGNVSNLYKTSLPITWKKIATQEIKDLVRKSNYCELVDIFGIEIRKSKSNDLKITQMIFYTDEKDLRYVFSGFTSAKKLFSFIKKINLLIDNNKYEELSKFIEYPSSSIDEVKIRKSSDFINAAEKIITPKVKKLLKAAETGENFTLLNQGIMLNSRGDVWLVSYVDKGNLIRINDPR